MKYSIQWFINNPVAANLLMICIVVLGLLALPQSRQELIPNVSLETISVQTTLPGAAVEAVEASLCKPLENRLFDLQGIRELTSMAYEGLCVVSLGVEEGTDTRDLMDEVSKRVDDRELLPADATEPEISEVGIQFRVVKLILNGDVSYAVLTELARQIRADLLDNPAISVVELQDTNKSEIRVQVPAHNLEKYNLSYPQIAAMIQQQTGFLPGGVLETGGGEVLITSDAYKDSVDAYREIVVLSDDTGAEVLLGDIAEITDTRINSTTRASFDGSPSVSLDVFRVGDQNIMEIAAIVNAYVEKVQASLPPQVKLNVWQDDSRHFKSRIDLLVENALIGLVLLFITLLLFLNFRLSFWVSVGIPVSFLGAFSVMPGFDVSINSISLFGFILVLGIVVDDAVVVGEAIYLQNQSGVKGKQGALRGVLEVYKPILFAVATSVVAFMPLLDLPGPSGKVMQSIPIVVIATLIFSLIESLYILPAHLSHSGAPKSGAALGWLGRIQRRFDNSLTWFVVKYYTPVLRWCLQIKGLILTVFTVAFVIMLVMMITGWIKSSLYTPIEADVVVAKVVFPEGTPRVQTERAVKLLSDTGAQVQAEFEAEGKHAIEHIYTAIGVKNLLAGKTNQGNLDHTAEVTIEMGGHRGERVSAQDVMARWRELTGDITGVNQLSYSASLNPSRPDIQIELTGQDLDQLIAAAKATTTYLGEFDGIFDVHYSLEDSKPQAEVVLKDNAAAMGLTQQEVISQINQAFQGTVVQRVQTRDDEVGVWLGLPEHERASGWYLENMHIRFAPGEYVSLATIADVNYYESRTHIKRYNRKRVVTVTAFVDPNRNSVMQLQKSLTGDFLPALVKQYSGMAWSEGGQQRELAYFMERLLDYYLLAVLGMYLLMAVLFKSYTQPLLVLYAIPFGIMGSVLGHQLFGFPLTSWSYVGMVAVSGVVVNDNLVLMDYINNRRAEGVSVYNAVVDAGRARFRPILLTSITTFVGLVPLITETSVQAQFLIPMAISLAFGVLFATVISLLLVPVTYALLEDGLESMRTLMANRETDTVEKAYQVGYEQGLANQAASNPYKSELLMASWEAGFNDGQEAEPTSN